MHPAAYLHQEAEIFSEYIRGLLLVYLYTNIIYLRVNYLYSLPDQYDN